MTSDDTNFPLANNFRLYPFESTSTLRETSHRKTSGSSWNQWSVLSTALSTPSNVYSAVTPSWSTSYTPPTRQTPISN